MDRIVMLAMWKAWAMSSSRLCPICVDGPVFLAASADGEVTLATSWSELLCIADCREEEEELAEDEEEEADDDADDDAEDEADVEDEEEGFRGSITNV